MKRTRIDKLGRLVIPIGYRKELNITTDTDLIVDYENDKIVISKIGNFCKICNKEMKEENTLSICNICWRKIKSTN